MSVSVATFFVVVEKKFVVSNIAIKLCSSLSERSNVFATGDLST